MIDVIDIIDKPLEAPVYPHRPIRSFVRRAGRTADNHQAAFADLWPVFGLDVPALKKPIEFSQIFNRTAPVILEIGYGRGDSLRVMAQDNPEQDYLGIEVHQPGVACLLSAIRRLGLQNIRLINYDAVEILKNYISDDSLTGVQIFFSDPWPKTRHHKRRLIQPDFVDLLSKKVKKSGFVHLATDWVPYAEQMQEVFEASMDFQNRFSEQGFSARPDTRPMTRFEKRGIELGHEVRDLIFDRI
jgi:tRNA (guanine-N7-)-methyltransferase